MELASIFVEKLLDYTIKPIGQQLGYLIFYHKNIEVLKNQVEELKDQQADVQNSINEASRNGEMIKDTVQHWMSRVDEMTRQAQQLYVEESQARTDCSRTLCPNLWSCYQLSKRAKKMGLEVVKIQEKQNFHGVSYLGPPKLMLDSTNDKNNEGIDSRVPIMNQIIEALGDPNVNMIGLCGLGGVGKTTIAKEAAKRVMDEKMFEKVIMAIVSDDSNLENIQCQIAEMLGMKLEQKTKISRTSRLCEKLKQEKNLLIILDDLWNYLDLGEVGIPFIEDGKLDKRDGGCKILLTSRNEELLSNQMKCKRIIKVGVLSEKEAWELFKRVAELSIDLNNLDFIKVANEIVQKCQGLPLAIVAIAGALRSKDLNEWRDALRRLKNPLRRNITGIKNVDSILRLSYDRLSSELQPIFLLSAMLSHDVLLKDLLMYSVGLDLHKGAQNMEEAQDEIFTFVSKLKASNLLLGSFSAHHFTTHDVIREVALSVASTEHFFVMRHVKLNEWPDENSVDSYNGICLEKCDINDLPEELYGPTLKFFLLNSIDPNLNITSMFFKSSKQLKVLGFSNMNFSSLPLLGHLERLRTLCLHSCLLEDIAEVGKLKKLKILSLAYSEIEQLPFELAHLTCLQMLNLAHCSKLRIIPPKLLSSLERLEVLHLENSFNHWEVEGSCESNENASLGELKNLPISSLDIHIPDASVMPEDLFLDNNALERYRIFIGEHWKWYGNYETSKTLKLELKSGIHLVLRVQKLLEKVEDLCLDGSNGLKNVLFNFDRRGFPYLKHLHIKNNNAIEYVVFNPLHLEVAFPILMTLELQNLNGLKKLCQGPEETFKSLFNSKVSFPKLEKLELFELNNLILSIWDDQLPHNSFSNLKMLTVQDCGFVKLVPLHVLKSLNNLEALEVAGCDMLEMVFDLEELNSSNEILSSLAVPLKKLNLWRLPKLKHVWSNDPQRIVSFQSLQQVHVYFCESLTGIFPASIAKGGMPQLEELEIWNCGIEEIIAKDEVSEPFAPTFVFPSLITVLLRNLPNLKNFYPHSHKSKWPCLQTLTISSCKESEIFEQVFPILEKLTLEPLGEAVVPPFRELSLSFLKKAKHIWDEHLPPHLLQHLETLDVSYCYDLISLGPSSISLTNLTYLNVSDCEELNNLLTSSTATSLANLSFLRVSDCKQIEEIITKTQGEDDEKKEIIFHKLECLELDGLLRLKSFCSHNYIFKFPLLDEVIIKECPRLRMFCLGDIHTPLLECVEVAEGQNFWDTNLNTTSQQRFTTKEVISTFQTLVLDMKDIIMIRNDQFPLDIFPQVKALHVESFIDGVTFPYSILERFPNLCELHVENSLFEEIFPSQAQTDDQLKNVWNDNSQLQLIHQNLQVLEVNSCCSLIKLAPSSGSFENLTELKVSSCHQLLYLVTSSTAQSLVNLHTMKIKDCKMMEEIVTNETNEDVDGGITFHNLIWLELANLPSLRRFYLGVLKTPWLSEVKIEESYMDWRDEGDLNKTIELLFPSKVSMKV